MFPTSLVVDFVKLSHHGSIRNINLDFLSLIRTNQYVILANGNKSYWHPNKETLVMIIDYHRAYNKKISFIFNHEVQSIFKDAFPLFKSNEIKENNINKDGFELIYKRFL